MPTLKQLNAISCSISLAASATTDGLEATIQVVNARGDALAGVRKLEVWISEDAEGEGLTADSYSGAVTATVGTILTALTAKKHFECLTSADGIVKLLAVASANPADQYICVNRPDGEGVIVSVASGTNWEGA